MRKITINGNQIVFDFEYNPEIINDIKKFFRFREWNSRSKTWEVIITDRVEKEKLEEIIQKYNFSVKEESTLIFNEILLKEDVLRLYYVDDSLSEEEKKALKKCIVRRNDKYDFYDLSITKSSLDLIIRLIDDNKLFVSEKMKTKILEKYTQILEEIEKSQKISDEIEIPDLKKSLFPFQRAGVVYMIEKGRVLLADEMGLGKTIQAIATVVHQKAFPCLVVCPASLKYNWKKEIIQTTDHSVSVIESKNGKNGTNRNENISDFVVINYDILSKYLDSLKEIEFKSLIIDESHYIKNQKAQRTKAVLEIAKTLKEKDGKIYLLTGTPILNRPVELIPQLKALGVFERIAKKEWDYLMRYCGGWKDIYGWHFDRATNIQELQEKLRATCMIRRQKKDVLTELPEKIRDVIYITVNDPEYFKLEEEYQKEEDVNKKIGYISRLYAASGIAKTLHTLEWIENFYENFDKSKKLVVFAYHQEVQNALYTELQKKGYKVLKLTADMDSSSRHHAVQQFQNDSSIQIIVVSLRAGGEGITLTAADTVLFVETYWVPALLTQAEDRLHRISQKSNVTAYYLLAMNTIDMAIWSIASEKENIFAELTKGIELTKEQKEMKELIKNSLKKAKEIKKES